MLSMLTWLMSRWDLCSFDNTINICYQGAINFTKMIFIRIVSLYYCRRIVYFVTDAEKFVPTDVSADTTAVLVVTYVAYVLCNVMTSACMSNLWLRTVMGSNIRVGTIVGINNHNYGPRTAK